MKILTIVLLVVCTFSGYAQKAYEAVNYKGTLQGQTIKLSLANGYVGASKISIISNTHQTVTFLPESGVPDSSFILRPAAKARADYFILDNIKEAYSDLPAYITATYIKGRQHIAIRFHLVK